MKCFAIILAPILPTYARKFLLSLVSNFYLGFLSLVALKELETERGRGRPHKRWKQYYTKAAQLVCIYYISLHTYTVEVSADNPSLRLYRRYKRVFNFRFKLNITFLKFTLASGFETGSPNVFSSVVLSFSREQGREEGRLGAQEA